MRDKIIREKKHRLDENVYIGERPVSFTICIKDKKKFFTNSKIFELFNEILISELTDFNCSSYVYLFMPDHVHMVLTGSSSGSSIKKCLEMFKQKTGYWMRKNYSESRWQKDYYDHVLRKEDNLDIHIKYILNNPVRAGLVEYWKQYPYKGSTIYELSKWSDDW